MALIAKTVKVPANNKYTGHEHLPGRAIKIFANPVMNFTDTVRRRNGAANIFRNLQLVDLGCLKSPLRRGFFMSAANYIPTKLWRD